MDARRFTDIVVSSLALPVVAFVAAAASVTMRHAFFEQERVGLNGKHFTICKIRTMEDGRITRVGRIIRPFAIDELPQFVSVLKGDMSLIGPRPIPINDDAAARVAVGAEKWNLRYFIKPGLAPPSLIREKLKSPSGNDPKMRLIDDLAYIEKRKTGHALKEDLKILWSVAHTVLTRRADPQSKTPAFSFSAGYSAEKNIPL